MAYRDFAYWYDELNAAADYDGLAQQLVHTLHGSGITDGIVADLGCGTGEVALRLAAAGYDMIAVDGSADMLSVFREKLDGLQQPPGRSILLLQQDLAELDLFGTVRAVVSTFDTLNHLPQEAVLRTIQRAALFLEPGGAFVFDANTPYKHETVLANNAFELEDGEGRHCVWRNSWDAGAQATRLAVSLYEDGEEVFSEIFHEYSYPLAFWRQALAQNGLRVQQVLDGESFGPLVPATERYYIAAIKEE